MTCKADCFRDGSTIRPVKAPARLVWLYFNVQGEPSGTLELRRFAHCDCGCNNLIADPPYEKDQAPSHLSPPPQEKVEIQTTKAPGISLGVHWLIRIVALLVIALLWYVTRH